MCFETLEAEQLILPKRSTNLQDHHSRRAMMDARTMNNSNSPPFPRKGPHTTTTFVESRKIEYQRSFSQGHGRKMFSSKSYFSLESLFILICLAASLLVLPLILPPLPPPPFMLLLLPICLLVVLVFLAFMPSNVRDVTYA